MSLKETLNDRLAKYKEVREIIVRKDANNHGRKGTSVEVLFEDNRLEMYFADNNKMDHDTVATLMQRAVESFINGTMDESYKEKA